MNPIIDSMLGLTAEIAEELLLVKDSGRDSLSDDLKLKIISLAELAATVDAPQPSEADLTVDSCQEAVLPEKEAGDEPEEEEPEKPEVSQTPQVPQEKVEQEEKEEYKEEEPEPAEDTVVLEMEPDTDLEPDPEPALESVSEPAAEPVPEPEIEAPVEVMPESTAESVGEPVVEASGRRVNPADIYRSFSINDAFFFRREIFGGSRQQFDEALDYISTLPGRRALQEYLVECRNLNLNESPGKEFYQALAVFF